MAQMAAQQQEETAPDTVAEQEESQQIEAKQDNQAEAIKFIKQKLQTSFDETSAKQLFEYYTLDKNTQRLQPPDVRKLLLDILFASEWPLVVPDESLEAVLQELCLNDEGSISWIEFKSFFVFLQDRPLTKLFEIITKFFSQKEISYSRLITIKPIRMKPINDDIAAANDDDDNNNNDDNKINDEPQQQKQQNYYDRNKWKNAVQTLIPQAKQIFIYFMDGTQILALALGQFENVLAEPAAAEVKLDDITYLATIRAFDAVNDMFPPIARSGGMKSKVARKIADSYIIARQWDERHLKLVEKAGNAAHTVSIKWTQFDEKYKVNERVEATTSAIINSVKAFDEKHQLTRRLSSGAKSFNEKYGITEKLGNVAGKIASNEKVQIVSTKVNESFKAAVKTIDDINQETQQLVQEKRQQQQEQGGQQQQQQEVEQQNEGDGNNNNNNAVNVAQQQQQYGGNNNDGNPVQVQAQ